MQDQGEVVRSPVVKFVIQQPPFNATMKNVHIKTVYEKLHFDTEALKVGTHGDQVPLCELPIFIKNLVAGTKIWSQRLAPSNYASPYV